MAPLVSVRTVNSWVMWKHVCMAHTHTHCKDASGSLFHLEGVCKYVFLRIVPFRLLFVVPFLPFSGVFGYY